MIQIDKNVPIPQLAVDRNRKYPFRELEVGDSFLWPSHVQSGLRAQAAACGKILGRKFTVRKTPEGFRVWRTE